MSQTLTSLKLGTDPKYFKPKKLSECYAVGIELEIEGHPTGLDNLNPTLWQTTSDGSLRNGGVEIICKRGLSGVKLERAIENLDEVLSKSRFSLSERCSTHIHLDVTDMTLNQICNLVCLSIVFEHCMFNLFGTGRGSNNFCLTTDCGTDNYENLVNIMSRDYTLSSVVRSFRWAKYAAIGLHRFRDLGTVEYRMFSPLTTESQYTRVIEFLFALKREAMSIESPQDIIEYKKVNTLEAAFRRLFGTEVYNEQMEIALERGIKTLNDILTAVRVVKEVEAAKKKYESIMSMAEQQIRTIERGL